MTIAAAIDAAGDAVHPADQKGTSEKLFDNS
jgi:hypothetical protein